MAYQSVNPATGDVVKTFTAHDQQKIDQTLKQAQALFKSDWSQHAQLPQRLAVLVKFADLLLENKEQLATLMSSEMGKLIAQGRDEIELCAKIARYYSTQAPEFLKPVQYPTDLGEAWVENHPLGLIMAVEPWNFPFYQLMRVFAPNYAIGNPVMLKHASIVPQCAEKFETLIREAGAPEGAFTNLFINPDQVAQIIADQRVQGVALTGSEGAGSVVAEQAGKYLKKSTLELGGNDVFVVLDDADLEKAIMMGCQARLNNAGQVCTAAKRFILHEKIAAQFKQGMLETFKAIKIGDPLDESTQLGPLSSKDAVDKLYQQVQKAVKQGATLLTGGKPVQGKGFFFEPTILENISTDNEAWYEEFFGPVAQIYIAKDEEEIVAIANNSNYGLGGAIHSKDIDRAKKLASRIETGMLWINWYTASSPELPFGGVKRSGYGHELADLGFSEFIQKRLVVVKSAE